MATTKLKKNLKLYREYSIKITSSADREFQINLFPSHRKIIDEYWYFSYGFIDNFVYVFKKKYQAVEIEFYGLAELIPSLSTSLMFDSREFERYFIDVMAQRELLFYIFTKG